jgi:hypothetical protein
MKEGSPHRILRVFTTRVTGSITTQPAAVNILHGQRMYRILDTSSADSAREVDPATCKGWTAPCLIAALVAARRSDSVNRADCCVSTRFTHDSLIYSPGLRR